MADWNKQHNPIPLIIELEKTRSVNAEGNVQFGGFGIMVAFPKLEAMVTINPEITLEDKLGIVQQSIFKAGRKGELTSQAIMAEIIKLEKEYLSSRLQNYTLATSLSIDNYYHKLPNLQINKNRITFTRNFPKYFTKPIYNNSQINFFLGKRGFPTKYLCARIAVKAKSIHQATEKALVSFNLFRGILNFGINYGQQSFLFGGASRKPINKILLGPIHTLHKPNGKMAANDLFWYEPEYREPLQPYHNNIVGEFDKILKFVGEARRAIQKSKISKKLQDAILLYNDALDSYNYEVSYTKLWAVLELLTGTGTDDDHKVTVRRVAFIFNNPEEERVHIDILRRFRNDLVHRGHMNAKLEIFVYDLKLYVEKLLRFLIFNHFRFNSFSDVAYLLDRSTNYKELNKWVKLASYAQKINKKRKLS